MYVIVQFIHSYPTLTFIKPHYTTTIRHCLRQVTSGVVDLSSNCAIDTHLISSDSTAQLPVKGNIQKFLEDAANPDQRVNCLDVVTYGGNVPYLVRQVNNLNLVFLF
jgi:hypothetical protein